MRYGRLRLLQVIRVTLWLSPPGLHPGGRCSPQPAEAIPSLPLILEEINATLTTEGAKIRSIIFKRYDNGDRVELGKKDSPGLISFHNFKKPGYDME